MFTQYKYCVFVLLSSLLIESISCFPAQAKVVAKQHELASQRTADASFSVSPHSQAVPSDHQGLNMLDTDSLCHIVNKLTLPNFRSFYKKYPRATICLRNVDVMVDILVNTYGRKGFFEALKLKIEFGPSSDTLKFYIKLADIANEKGPWTDKFMNRALVEAVKSGPLIIVQYLVRKFLMNNDENASRATQEIFIAFFQQREADTKELMLLNAVRFGRTEVVSYLLDQGFTVPMRGLQRANLLVEALVHPRSNIDTVNLLCDRKVASIPRSMVLLNQNRLLVIVANNNREILQLVLRTMKGCFSEVDVLKMIAQALRYKHIDTAEFIRSTVGVDIHIGNDALMAYHSYHNVEAIIYLQSKGANIHARNDNALLLTSNYGKFESIRYLMEQGAVVRFEMLVTPCIYGNLRVMKLLLQGVDKKDIDLMSLLNMAEKARQTSMLRFLLKWGRLKSQLRWRTQKIMRVRKSQ
jgi:hypothetical protein